MQETEATIPNQPIPPPAIYKHPPGYRLRRGQNWFFLGLTYASYYLCRNNLSMVGPELKHELKLNNEQFGEIQSARDWTYAFGQFVNGLLSDRLGGKLSMTIGAAGTAVFNTLFGLSIIFMAGSTKLLIVLILLRAFDGYVQAFGAPGMVKINAAWFRRQERGGFAGIFGGMIQLGAIGVGLIGKLITTGTLPLFAASYYSLKLVSTPIGWKWMFFIPPIVVMGVIVLMNLMVKNHPEEARYRIVHDDETAGEDPHERMKMSDVFARIAGNPTVWIVACAYFCTGFVRKAIESYWVIWLDSAWHLGKASAAFTMLVFAVPLTAFLGSLFSGLVSDKLFKGRRAPVAGIIYLVEAMLAALGIMLAMNGIGGLAAALAVLIGINTTCNSSHSILGTAAPMDLGGRKMAGFAAGLIDSFQYIGAGLAGKYLGRLLDVYALPATAWRATATATATAASQVAASAPSSAPATTFNAAVWFGSMLPFAAAGALLMAYVWYRNRGKDTRGA